MSDFLTPDAFETLVRLTGLELPDREIRGKLHDNPDIRQAWAALVKLLMSNYNAHRLEDQKGADPGGPVVGNAPTATDLGQEPLESEPGDGEPAGEGEPETAQIPTLLDEPTTNSKTMFQVTPPGPVESVAGPSDPTAPVEVAPGEGRADPGPREPAESGAGPSDPAPPDQAPPPAFAGSGLDLSGPAPAEDDPAPKGEPPEPVLSSPVQPALAATPTPVSGAHVMRGYPRLPNGSVGKAYDEDLVTLLHLDPGTVISPVQEWPQGLVLDPAGRLKGTPTAHADLKMAWRAFSGGRELHGTLQLTINPDPRSLWQDKPSDSAGIFPKPDRVHVGCHNNLVRVMAASVRGRSHAHVGSYRDDDYAFDIDTIPGCSILAVGDGAGSASYSRKGSEVACQRAVAVILKKLGGEGPDSPHPLLGLARKATPGYASGSEPEWTARVNAACYDVLASAAFEAARAVQHLAEQNQIRARECATTLLLGVVIPAAEGWFVATYWVGDGAIAAWDGGAHTLKLLCEPDSGQFAGETQFLTGLSFNDSTEIASRMKTRILERFDYIALMSDGISDPWFESEASLNSVAHWEQFTLEIAAVLDAGEASAGAEILNGWMDFWSTGNHDDRTLLLLQPWPRREK